MSRAEFAYVQARLQARLGRRPAAAAWQALDASRSVAHALALARAGAWAPWVEGLPDGADAHGIERHLGARWQREVEEVARWLPPPWRPALRCFGRLPALAQSGEPAAPRALAEWRAEWQRALTTALPAGTDHRAALQRPAQWLLPRLVGGPARAAAATESLQQALRRLLRRHGGSAAAAFAYLALVALDTERLRGGLVVRALLAPRPGGTVPEAA